jgi:mannose-1-phosphate guanylyltransferase
LTNDRPKALVTVAGRTLLEITLERLRAFGVREVIVNAHHFAGMIDDYLKANHNFGMHVEVSHEAELLDTGGGLKKASAFFLDAGTGREKPFILHNVDVLSTIDLDRMIADHAKNSSLATLAVQDRETSRKLLFDARNQFCGRSVKSADTHADPSSNGMRALAFCGIHIVSTRLFARMREQGAFSIIDAYLELAAQGEKVVAFDADRYYWRDLGKPESIAQAEQDLAAGLENVVADTRA